LSEAERLDDLTEELRAFLPAQIAHQCRVAGHNGNTLIVLADNASIATRLQYLQGDTLPRLRQISDFAEIEAIKVNAS